MSDRLAACAWPGGRLHQALEAAAGHAGLGGGSRELPAPPAGLDREAAGEWIEATAAWIGLEAEPVVVVHAELESFLRRAAPGVVRLATPEGDRYLVVAAAGRRELTLVAPDLRRRRVPLEALRDALARPLEEPLAAETDALLERLAVRPRRRRRARRALLDRRLEAARLDGIWLLRLPPGAPFLRQLRRRGLPRRVGTVVLAHLVQQLLFVGSWWMLGRGVLMGRVDPGWLAAWALLLLSMTPFRAVEQWTLGRLTTEAGALLKRRLLAGALRLEPEETRHQGVGQFLGRVIDSEAVETLALTGGHLGLIAAIELALAAPILALGAGGPWHVVSLLAWLALTGWLGLRYVRERRAWTRRRLRLTHDLVETMVGHRTRLVQLPPQAWHQEEDRLLGDYLDRSRAVDRRAARLRAIVPRGWLLVGMAGLAPAFVAGGASVAGLAIGVGGVLFAYRALWQLTRGLSDLAEAAIAWDQVAPLFHAAARVEPPMPPELVAARRAEQGRQPLIEARELSFAYPGRAEPVLRGVDLAIARGDRLLVEGESGSGKSTLTALLAGLRLPDSGLLLLDGFDRNSLGSRGWRRRVAAAPQFHENHVFSETMSFNLLMGRGWPPSARDFEQAEEVCRALGLGELLDRMPSGLQQIVGESGWQLSHGERNRLFLARALLQGGELMLLDESFAALDPETLQQAMQAVRERAGTLLVVAHP